MSAAILTVIGGAGLNPTIRTSADFLADEVFFEEFVLDIFWLQQSHTMDCRKMWHVPPFSDTCPLVSSVADVVCFSGMIKS
jgi:hypothetical protein